MKTLFRDELLKCIQNYPILYVPHFHQKYICDEIRNVCAQLFIPRKGDTIVTTIEGSHKELETLYKKNKGSSDDYVDYIVNRLTRHIGFVRDNVDYSSPICILKDVDSALLNDGRFVALMHEFVEYYEEGREKPNYNCLTIVLCVPSCEMPPHSISSISYVVNIQPPPEEEIRQELFQMEISGDSQDITEYVRALQGLYLFDIRQIIRSTQNTYGKIISKSAVRWAYEEKQELVRKTGVLEVIEPDVSLKDVGGLERLKRDIESSARLYKNLPLLQEANVPIPKGYLLLGMPGCGKTMIAKATAAEFGCPLLKLDIGKLLGKYVGDSEHNLQIALDVVDSAHPCVLWIDEIEKAFAGTNNSSGEGNDVMIRLMGKFLSWMQERHTAVFIMATANDVLKPELMRKGRFDEVYFVDFPSRREAEAIIKASINNYSKSKLWKTINKFFNSKNVSDDTVNISDFAKAITNIIDVSKLSGDRATEKDVAIMRGLSGAEIKSLIDSFIASQIAKLIELGGDTIDLDKAYFLKHKQDDNSHDITFDDKLSESLQSAMINQLKDDCHESTSERHSNIAKIYACQQKYRFKMASD